LIEHPVALARSHHEFRKTIFLRGRKHIQIETERLTMEVLKRARLALRHEPSSPVRQPVPARQFASVQPLRTSPESRYLQLLREYPEPAIISFCMAICAFALLQNTLH